MTISYSNTFTSLLHIQDFHQVMGIGGSLLLNSVNKQNAAKLWLYLSLSVLTAIFQVNLG